MKLNLLSNLFLAAVLASGAFGCKKKMDRVTPLPGYGAGSTTIKDVGPGTGLGNGLANNGNGTGTGTDVTGANVPKNPDGTLPQTGTRVLDGREQNRDKYHAQTVYFEFDRANVKAGEAAKVQQVADGFRNENPNSDLLIEGHCDERGTEEYNRSLGERRALALRELIVAAGVSPDRVHTVSFGKDKPVENGHSESAWSKNRRGEFILVLPK